MIFRLVFDPAVTVKCQVSRQGERRRTKARGASRKVWLELQETELNVADEPLVRVNEGLHLGLVEPEFE